MKIEMMLAAIWLTLFAAWFLFGFVGFELIPYYFQDYSNTVRIYSDNTPLDFIVKM